VVGKTNLNTGINFLFLIVGRARVKWKFRIYCSEELLILIMSKEKYINLSFDEREKKPAFVIH
jgi:hypothetical protein